eukprot:g1419.t1
MSAYDRHLARIREYVNVYGDDELQRFLESVKRRSFKSDLDVLKEEHRFLFDEDSDEDEDGGGGGGGANKDRKSNWGKRIAKEYHRKLFKEYALADLSRYRKGQIGLRFRTKKEVVGGKGQFVCGALGCGETQALESFEVNFRYVEVGKVKNALVKRMRGVNKWEDEIASSELLHYYRNRVDSFEKERSDAMDRLDSIEVAYKDAHRVEWELRLREEEIAELQRALSDSHVLHQDMKRDISSLRDENERLRHAEMASRLRIDELLAITPGMASISSRKNRAPKPIVKDCRPHASGQNKLLSSSATKNITSIGRNVAVRKSRTSDGKARKGTFAPPKAPSVHRGGLSNDRVVKAVFVADASSSQSGAVRGHVESLEQALERLRLESGRQIRALKEDRRVRMEEERVRTKQLSEELAECRRRLQEKQRQLVIATRDFFKLKHESQEKERELIEEANKHRVLSTKLSRELDAERRAAIVREQSQRFDLVEDDEIEEEERKASNRGDMKGGDSDDPRLWTREMIEQWMLQNDFSAAQATAISANASHGHKLLQLSGKTLKKNIEGFRSADGPSAVSDRKRLQVLIAGLKDILKLGC